MAHYAKVINGVVTEVNVVDWETLNIEGHPWGDPSLWIQTSYNTQGGEHKLGGTPLHKNYAGIGYTWDGTGFAPPQPFASWTKNANTYLWEPPVAMPSDAGTGTPPKMYTWNEETVNWVEVVHTETNTQA
jgi:hypothetical protein